MKKLVKLLLVPVFILIAWPALAFNIDIHQVVEHPSLALAVKGFKDYLQDNGIEAAYKEYNAQNNVSLAQQNVNQIISDKPDLILTVGTMVSQTTVNKIQDIPIFFTAVTDPEAAQIVDSNSKPGGNVTGTSDITPIAEQVALVREFQPHAKNIGTIYNPGEINSVVQVEQIKKACQTYNFKLFEAIASDNAGVTRAAQSLISKVDAIFLPTDNTAISSYESIMKVAIDHKIPTYTIDGDSLVKGATASLSLDYYKLGRQTGAMAIKVLRGEAQPADLPVEFQTELRLTVNETFNNLIGFTVPAAAQERIQDVLK
jgi:putative ABC transport system substrate-binding protein